MRRTGSLTALLLALVTLGALSSSAFAATSWRPGKASLSPQMQRMVELVNQRRREAGLHPVTVHPTLMTCAQQYSEVQASLGGISHAGPDGSNPGQRLTRCGYRWKHYGENLAAGYVNVDEVVSAWMASPGHRRVLLHRKVREIGLGFAHRDNDPNRYYDYYVMEMGLQK